MQTISQTGDPNNPKPGDKRIRYSASHDIFYYSIRSESKGWLLHREDGPAVHRGTVKRSGNYTEYHLFGEQYRTEEEWQKAVEVYKAKQITELF